MSDRELSVRSRTLAARLHLALKTRGWTVTRLAAAMGWSHSKASRFLSCKRGTNVLDVATVLGHLGVRGPDRVEILELAADPYECSWWRERGERLAAHLPVLSGQEDCAATIFAFHPTLVPELLQHADYTRAVLRAGSAVLPSEVDKHVALLHHRQTVVGRKEPPELRFVLDQHALTHSGTGRVTIAGQVRHLLALSGRPHITIRVLPGSAALLRGYPAFELLTYADGNPTVYLEMLNATGFLEQPTTVDIFHRALSDLENAALDEHESRTWLTTLAATLDRS